MDTYFVVKLYKLLRSGLGSVFKKGIKGAMCEFLSYPDPIRYYNNSLYLKGLQWVTVENSKARLQSRAHTVRKGVFTRQNPISEANER